MIKTYTNPIARQGDFADPFVLRHDGRYYLYGTNPDVRCWVSDNLIDWTLCGATITEDEFPELVPFAPEVVYHNGFFYMYTSPHGRGHFVLRSDKPTGPFRKITGNIGHAIDFSVFVDEDGRWYAYWADDAGILGCEMTSPTEFSKPQLIGAYLHGWTEGPFIVKADGKYHLTYTGNHYLSKGYRIHAAVSDHPLGPYTDVKDNPVIVRTAGDVVGLGHSSTVLGPNLLSYYIAYHNLNQDRTRDLNIDEVVFEPEGMIVLGPTCSARNVPAMPDVCCRGAEELPGVLGENGALEMNMTAGAKTDTYGVQLGSVRIAIDREEHALTVTDKEAVLVRMALPKGFCHEALHRLFLKWHGTSCRIWLDALRIYDGELSLGGVKAQYIGDGLMPGFAAYTKEAACELALPCCVPKNRKLGLGLEVDTACLLTWNSADEHAAFEIDGQVCSVAAGDFGVKAITLTAGRHDLIVHGLWGAKIMPQNKNGGDKRVVCNQFGPYAKACMTDPAMDAEVEVRLDAKPCEEDWEAGVLMRASELADGGEGDDPVLGKNFMIGYRVAIGPCGVTLYRHRYDCVRLAQAVCLAKRLKVRIHGNTISVYADDACVIHYTDETPVISGCMGFDARGCLMDGEMTCTTAV